MPLDFTSYSTVFIAFFHHLESVNRHQWQSVRFDSISWYNLKEVSIRNFFGSMVMMVYWYRSLFNVLYVLCYGYIYIYVARPIIVLWFIPTNAILIRNLFNFNCDTVLHFSLFYIHSKLNSNYYYTFVKYYELINKKEDIALVVAEFSLVGYV